MLPDIEKVFVFVMTGGFYHKLVLHSFLGAGTLGTFLSVLVTVFLYPTFVSFIFKIDKENIREKCRFSLTLILTCFFGCASHVLVDSLHHEFNPLVYPFTNESFDMFLLFGDWNHATVLIQTVLLTLSILTLFLELRKGTKGFWKRTLVG